MPQSATPNMLLIQPSENGDAGVWDTLLTAVFLLIDAHEHSAGKGVTVKTAGITINADLSASSGGNFFAVKDVKTLDFQPSTAASMTSYASNLFVNSSDSNNLYFRTAGGTNVRITNGTALDITSSGGIGGDYTAVAAEAAFSDSGKEYTWKQKDPDNFWAAMRSGPLRVAQLDTTESVYVEIATPAALASSYTITLPLAAPATANPVMMSTSGVLSALTTNDNITLSGTGELKHGDRVLHVNVCAGAPGTTGPEVDSNASAHFVEEKTGASGQWLVPIPLRAGDRIKGISYAYKRAAGTMDFTFVTTDFTTGVDTVVNTVSVSSGTTYATSNSTALTTTLNSTTITQPMIRWLSGGTGDRFHAVLVTYDRP